MERLREAVADWVEGLIVSRHVRLWTSLVIWVQMTIMLFGRGLRGLLSSGKGNPYSSTLEQYRQIRWKPNGRVHVPDTTAFHGSLSTAFWHWMWGAWVFFTVMLCVQLVIEFAEEVGRGWARAHRALTEKENVESMVPVQSTPASAGGGSSPSSPNSSKPGFRFTPLNFLELEVVGEFAGEALYRFWKKITGSRAAAGGAKP